MTKEKPVETDENDRLVEHGLLPMVEHALTRKLVICPKQSSRFDDSDDSFDNSSDESSVTSPYPNPEDTAHRSDTQDTVYSVFLTSGQTNAQTKTAVRECLNRKRPIKLCWTVKFPTASGVINYVDERLRPIYSRPATSSLVYKHL